MCFHRTQYDVLSVVFSSIEPRTLYVVEQKIANEVNFFRAFKTNIYVGVIR